MKSWYTIKAQAADGVAEISIHSEIGMWGVNAQQFLRDLGQITAGTINLSINSPGGSVFDALAIFNGLRKSGKTINVTVLGIAASAASYLAMAGDKITMPENTFMFIHRPINGVYGNEDDLRDMADILAKVGASLTDTYAKRWKGTDEELTAALAAETYLTAAECLELGLCDEVTSAIEAKAKFDTENLPENIRALFEPKPDPAPLQVAAGAPLADRIKATATQMGLGDYAAHFAVDPAITTEEQVVAALTAAVEVQALCAVAGMADRAPGLIRARKPLAEARAELCKALAEQDAAAVVDTAQRSKQVNAATSTAVQINPTEVYAKANAHNQFKRS